MEKKIYITSHKQQLLETLSGESSFENIKIYSVKEFLNIFPYKYTNQTLEYIMCHYHVILEVAKKYLENICRYNVEDYKNEKCLFLTKMKKELMDNHLLTENTLFKKMLKTARIILDKSCASKDLLHLLQEFSIEYTASPNKTFLPEVYELSNEEEEIVFVFEKIAHFIHQGVAIDRIYLTNVPESYFVFLKRIASQMNIPLSIQDAPYISQTTLGSIFIKNLHFGFRESLESIFPLLSTKEEEDIYNQLVSIVNSYAQLENAKEFILYDLNHTRVRRNILKTGIQVVSYKTTIFKEDDYVFFLSFNSDTIPVSFKDEEYFSDKLKEEMSLETSKDKNIREKRNVMNSITSTNHIVITYKTHTLNKEVYPSSLLENFEIQKGMIHYNVSDSYNRYALSKMFDNYTKYGTVSPLFIQLSSMYTIPYQTYSNAFTGISDLKIQNYFKNKLVLSYTKLNSYLACPFGFYLKYILKINPYEETFPIRIGNIFHKILEEMENEEFDYDYTFSYLIKDENFTAREKVLLNNLKEEFRFTLNLLYERKRYTELHSYEFERVESITIPSKVPVIFEGKIDLIRYNLEFKTFQLVDYKTGIPYLDASIMPLGFSLQLPAYLYLLKQDESFKDMQCGGFYLQPIFIEKQKEDFKTNYEITKQKAFKAIGYSNSNQDILGVCDFSYPDSVQIKGLKTKQDGSFYHYSKVYDEQDIDTLLKLVDDMIHKSLDGILSGDFSIQPKILDNKTNLSCDFCPFQDICFHTARDNVYVNSDKNFLKKEESHGLDE